MEPSISDIIHALEAEHLRSLEKHGDWRGYTVDDMVAATMAEVREFLMAHTLGDTAGPHGMLIEGLQAMNCFAKTLMELSRREMNQPQKGESSYDNHRDTRCTAQGS